MKFNDLKNTSFDLEQELEDLMTENKLPLLDTSLLARLMYFKIGLKKLLNFNDLEEVELVEEFKLDFRAVVSSKYNYFKAILDSLEITFDPLELNKQTTSGTNKRDVTDTLKETTTNNSTSSNTSTSTPSVISTNVVENVQDKKETTYDSLELKLTAQDTNKITTTDSSTGSDVVVSGGTNGLEGVKDNLNVSEELGEHTNIITGHINIDYVKAVASLYETKMINLYDAIIDHLSNVLLSSEYEL